MKNKNLLLVSLLALTLLVGSAFTVNATRVAVIGFNSEDSSWIDNKEKENEILEEIAWLLNDKLSDVEKYSVLNRTRMLNLLDEVRFSRGRRPTVSIINQLRALSNAEIFIYGSLERVKVETIDKFTFGPIKISDLEVTVDLSVDFIDARTARVTDTYLGSGTATVSGMNIVDPQGKGSGSNIVLEGDILNKAIERAVDDLIKNITGVKTDEEVAKVIVETEIISIVGERLVVNKGRNDGLVVGQTGEIIRYRLRDTGSPQLIIIGQAEVTDVGQSSAFLKTVYLNQDPQVGDIIAITVEEAKTTPRQPYIEPIKTLETRDFIIEINEAFLEGTRVTVTGTAYAKTNNAVLELILGNRDFYDHEGTRRNMSGRRVSIGDWLHSSSRIASIEETIQKDNPQKISWSFTGVPEKADKITLIELWLKTSYEGEISIILRDLKL